MCYRVERLQAGWPGMLSIKPDHKRHPKVLYVPVDFKVTLVSGFHNTNSGKDLIVKVV